MAEESEKYDEEWKSVVQMLHGLFVGLVSQKILTTEQKENKT